MTEEEIRSVYREARAQTSGKAARLAAVVFHQNCWMLLVQDDEGEEVAIRIEEGAMLDAEKAKHQIIEQMRRLF